jgi:pilus assembly protein Flp/PilA
MSATGQDYLTGPSHQRMVNKTVFGARRISMRQIVPDGTVGSNQKRRLCRAHPMRKLASAVWSFVTAEDGPTAVEYAVMLALIIIVCLVAILTIGQQTNSMFLKAASSLPS